MRRVHSALHAGSRLTAFMSLGQLTRRGAGEIERRCFGTSDPAPSGLGFCSECLTTQVRCGQTELDYQQHYYSVTFPDATRLPREAFVSRETFREWRIRIFRGGVERR